MLSLDATWREPAEAAQHLGWAQSAWAEMQPYATGGVYANFAVSDRAATGPAAYGANYERLQALKAEYDPHNLFRLNLNVEPRVARPG